VVVLRYVFNLGWIAMQESITYLHAYLFMMGAAYTLKHNGHVRVDIFYRNMRPHKKALVDMIGTVILLMPFCVFIFVNSWDDVIKSWALLEGSEQTGGLDLVYVLKSAMLIMPVLLLLQSIAEFLRQYLIFRDRLIPHPDAPQQEM
jgi:TRAP-type mannitol/chloroaromatic compound transport system permease small subunit